MQRQEHRPTPNDGTSMRRLRQALSIADCSVISKNAAKQIGIRKMCCRPGDHHNPPPENVAQYVGNNIELPCEFEDSSYDLLWSECTNDAPDCNVLYRNGAVNGGASPPARYSVNRTGTSGKRYDLVITGVQTADGGQFQCDNGYRPAPAYAEVIVLGSDMKCSNNLTSGSEVELGDFIYLSSDVTFHGRWPPVVRFIYPNNTVLTGPVDETSGVTAKYSVVLAAVKNLQGQTLSAEWYFDDVTGTAAGEASNIPVFPGSNTCSLRPITVYYPPEGVTIDPIQESYHVGETITCTAQGNPAPGIQWINVNDSSVTKNCPTGDPCQLVVSQDWLGTTAAYQCRPCNNYFSQERCIFQDITFTTHVTTTSSTTVPPTTTTTSNTEVTSTSDPNMAGECEQDIPDGFCLAVQSRCCLADGFFLSTGGLAGIIVVCVLLLPGNVYLAIRYWRKHGEGKNKGADSASVERTVTSPSYQNIATYVNVSEGPRGSGGATPVTQPGSDPYVNVSGGARGAGGAAPATQPGSEPYAELGPIRDPPRRAEYDVLRLRPAASDLDHDVTHNYING